jgi:hypothetical protein
LTGWVDSYIIHYRYYSYLLLEGEAMELELSNAARSTAGGLLLAIVAIEWGGTHMLRIVRGRVPVTDFQHAFARAGHAHAGVLVTLALVCQLFADAADLNGLVGAAARNGVPLAAILMPAGFFLSSMGRGAVRPNQFVLLLYAGVLSLAVGVLALGLGLLVG